MAVLKKSKSIEGEKVRIGFYVIHLSEDRVGNWWNNQESYTSWEQKTLHTNLGKSLLRLDIR